MSTIKMTNNEAKRLLEMLKYSLVAEIRFPARGHEEEFDVVGDAKSDVFSVNIFRGRINSEKYNIGARIKKNGTMLLELHINRNGVHKNPDGNKLVGNHWHIYSEEYGRTQAFPADDIEDDAFVDNTLIFLEKFNVVDPPEVLFQLELI